MERVVGRKRRKTENQRISMRIERDSKAERQRGVKVDREKAVGETEIKCSEMGEEIPGRQSRSPHPKRILDCARAWLLSRSAGAAARLAGCAAAFCVYSA